MTKGEKLTIQTWSAVAMLVAGTIMAFVSLFMPPVGEISTGALWYTGQCFLYAGGIMGISSYGKQKLDELERRLNKGNQIEYEEQA